MKLTFVEVAGFRGFRDRARFDIPAGFAVLTGRNGAGKSTLFDAIDFALTGTINKFQVKQAKGGGLNDHIWWMGDGLAEHHHVTLGFQDENGASFKITRSRSNGLVSDDCPMHQIFCINASPRDEWQETFMRTSLIRDETLASLSLDLPQQARFEAVRAAVGALAGPDYSERIEKLVGAAGAYKVEQESKVNEIQAELGRALEALTEARSSAGRQLDLAQAEAIIQKLTANLGQVPREATTLRRLVAERKQSIGELTEALDRATKLIEFLQTFNVDEATQSRAVLSEQFAKDMSELAGARSQLESAQLVTAAEAKLDEFTSHFEALLHHGEVVSLQEGHCPLCDAVRSIDEFTSSIAKARAQLAERGDRIRRAMAAEAAARDRVDTISQKIQEGQQKIGAIEDNLRRVADDQTRIEAIYSRYGLSASAFDRSEAQRQIIERQNQTTELEQALYILEASTAHDRVTTLEKREVELRLALETESARLASSEKTLETTRQMKSAAAAVTNQLLAEQFDTVMPLLKELYRRLRPHTDWREIETDFGGRVRASLNFTVGDGKNPQFLFSSGQRRAAGLAFLLAIHLSRPWCRLKSLFMDDPVQHVDDYRALNLVEVLSAIRTTGRQVVVAVEDAALADLLCRRLRHSAGEPGRRFELGTSISGSGVILSQTNIVPMPAQVLEMAQAS